MPVGMIALLIAAVAVYFGLAERALDRMRLTDRQALAVLVLIAVASLVNVNVVPGPVSLRVNLGGSLVPAAVAAWLWATADTAREKTRTGAAVVITAGFMYALARLMPAEPAQMFAEPTYLFGVTAGLVAYLVGRSRRGAFVAGVLGTVVQDLAQYLSLLYRGVPGSTWLGGAGAFDTTVLAGLVGVAVAEMVGEVREAWQGGPRNRGERL